jgi:excisionase family DNA binding protein
MSEPLFYTREQAAEVANVSKSTIVAAINTGKLRAKRTGDEGGGKYLISRDQLIAWFESLQDA